MTSSWAIIGCGHRYLKIKMASTYQACQSFMDLCTNVISMIRNIVSLFLLLICTIGNIHEICSKQSPVHITRPQNDSDFPRLCKWSRPTFASLHPIFMVPTGETFTSDIRIMNTIRIINAITLRRVVHTISSLVLEKSEFPFWNLF